MPVSQKDITVFQEGLESYFSTHYNIKDIVTDGVLQLESYNKAKFKIVWLLKEPYGKGEWDYAVDHIPGFTYQKPFPTSHRLWTNMVYVNYGILNDFPRYDDIADLDKDIEVYNHLRAGALINLKKTTGTSKSDYNNIKQHYERHKEFIHRQIEFVNPDIVICGGTFSIIRDSVLTKDTPAICDEWGFISNNRLYIDSYHPSYFGIDYESYYNQIINCCKQWVNESHDNTGQPNIKN